MVGFIYNLTILLQNVYFASAQSGGVKTLKCLSALGFGPNMYHSVTGKTALHYAIEHQQLAVVKYLLSQKASKFAKDPQGYSPLYYALSWYDKEAIDLLFCSLETFLDRDKHGRTLIDIAKQFCFHLVTQQYFSLKSLNKSMNTYHYQRSLEKRENLSDDERKALLSCPVCLSFVPKSPCTVNRESLQIYDRSCLMSLDHLPGEYQELSLTQVEPLDGKVLKKKY